jgi:cytochrome c oxidase subunit IV
MHKKRIFLLIFILLIISTKVKATSYYSDYSNYSDYIRFTIVIRNCKSYLAYVRFDLYCRLGV